ASFLRKTTSLRESQRPPALCSEQGTEVPRGWETTALLPGGRAESRSKPTRSPACCFFPSSVQVRPVFLPPSSVTLFLCCRPSIAVMPLHGQTGTKNRQGKVCFSH